MSYQILKSSTTIFMCYGLFFFQKNVASLLGESCKTHESCGSYEYGYEDKFLYCSKTDSKLETGICDCGVTSQNATITPPTSYEESESLSCPKWREDGESCINHFEYNSRFSLSCIQGICQCEPEQIKNEEDFEDYNKIDRTVFKGACLSKVGSTCRITEKFKIHRYDTQCVPQASCNATRNGVCVCNKRNGYKPTSTGFCGIGKGQRCGQSSSDSCWDNLRCSAPVLNDEITCKCPHPNYQTYDSKTESCRSALDTPCDPKDPNGCIALAECVQIGKNPFTCQCRNGTVITGTGKCEIAEGFPCDYKSDESDYSQIECSTEAKLVCKGDSQGNFKCACNNDGDIIEPGINRCVKPVGVRCSGNNECGMNARCKAPSGGKSWGICQCLSMFSVWNGRCDS